MKENTVQYYVDPDIFPDESNSEKEDKLIEIFKYFFARFSPSIKKGSYYQFHNNEDKYIYFYVSGTKKNRTFTIEECYGFDKEIADRNFNIKRLNFNDFEFINEMNFSDYDEDDIFDIQHNIKHNLGIEPESTEQIRKRENKEENLKMILYILIFILLVMGVGTYAYFYLGFKQIYWSLVAILTIYLVIKDWDDVVFVNGTSLSYGLYRVFQIPFIALIVYNFIS